MSYTISTEVDADFEEVVVQVTENLEEQGFGVLTDIDVQKVMKKKLDEEYDKYMILGACNPEFAHQALQTEKSVGALLPCNVIVHRKDGKTKVEAVNAEKLVWITENKELYDLATDVKDSMKKAIQGL